MLAYKLKDPIEIWENTEVKDSIGSLTETEVLVETVMADAQASLGRVAANDDRVLHTSETTFIIRNYPTVTYNHFIKFNGSSYRILAINQLPDRSGQIIKTVANGV